MTEVDIHKKMDSTLKSLSSAGKQLAELLLINTTYDKGGCLWFLDSYGKLIKYHDKTKHHPYLLTHPTATNRAKLSSSTFCSKFNVVNTSNIQKFDAIQDKNISMLKVEVHTPTDIYNATTRNGLRTKLKNPFQANIKYKYVYLFDKNLYLFMPCRIENGDIAQKDYSLIELFERDTPDISNLDCAIDIESEPFTNKNQLRHKRILAVSLYSKNKKIAYTLKDYNGDERKLLEDYFSKWNYLFYYSFVGDSYDLLHLYLRSQQLNVKNCPIVYSKIGRQDICDIKDALHLDLFKFFNNGSIRIYGFKGVYHSYPSLAKLAELFLDIRKLSSKEHIMEMTNEELKAYCLRDAEIHYKLTTFENRKTLRLIILISRITGLTLPDVCRRRMSSYDRMIFQRYHIKRNILIPNKSSFIQKNKLSIPLPITKGSKFKGAILTEPIPGVHFNTYALDYRGLYSSIIDEKNICYSTVYCNHATCFGNKIPEHSFHICKERRGILSEICHDFREIREKYRKKDSWSTVVQGICKVILNSMYGVFGDPDQDDLFCKVVPSAITSYARKSIMLAIEEAEKLGFKPCYVHTDSLFLPVEKDKEELINELVKRVYEKTNIELTKDKVFKLVIIHKKAHYLGVTKQGKLDVKGLTLKKKHIPPLFKKCFQEIEQEIKQINNPEDIEKRKNNIQQICIKYYQTLKNRTYNIKDLPFTVKLSRPLNTSTGQMYQAARLALKHNIKINPLEFQYVLTYGDNYTAKPLSLIKSKEEVNVKGYMSHLSSYLSQILMYFNISFAKFDKQLDRFFKKEEEIKIELETQEPTIELEVRTQTLNS